MSEGNSLPGPSGGRWCAAERSVHVRLEDKLVAHQFEGGFPFVVVRDLHFQRH